MARACLLFAVVTISKVAELSPRVRQVLRTMVGSSSSKVRKLCAGVPSSRRRVEALRYAACEWRAGATGSRVALAAWSSGAGVGPSANNNSRQASRMCHST